MPHSITKIMVQFFRLETKAPLQHRILKLYTVTELVLLRQSLYVTSCCVMIVEYTEFVVVNTQLHLDNSVYLSKRVRCFDPGQVILTLIKILKPQWGRQCTNISSITQNEIKTILKVVYKLNNPSEFFFFNCVQFHTGCYFCCPSNMDYSNFLCEDVCIWWQLFHKQLTLWNAIGA